MSRQRKATAIDYTSFFSPVNKVSRLLSPFDTDDKSRGLANVRPEALARRSDRSDASRRQQLTEDEVDPLELIELPQGGTIAFEV